MNQNSCLSTMKGISFFFFLLLLFCGNDIHVVTAGPAAYASCQAMAAALGCGPAGYAACQAASAAGCLATGFGWPACCMLRRLPSCLRWFGWGYVCSMLWFGTSSVCGNFPSPNSVRMRTDASGSSNGDEICRPPVLLSHVIVYLFVDGYTSTVFTNIYIYKHLQCDRTTSLISFTLSATRGHFVS